MNAQEFFKAVSLMRASQKKVSFLQWKKWKKNEQINEEELTSAISQKKEYEKMIDEEIERIKQIESEQ